MGTICPLPLIMKAKEKAEQLVERFTMDNTRQGERNGIKCALISVDEIINSNPHSNPLNTDVYSTMNYWLEVKNEINKL